MTLGQFTYELAQLPLISDGLYPEFFDIKFTSMKLTKKWTEVEEKTDEESLHKMQMIDKKFNELTDRLNVVFGNMLVN